MKAVNTNFKVIGLTRLGIKYESTAPEADDLITCHLSCSICRYLIKLSEKKMFEN